LRRKISRTGLVWPHWQRRYGEKIPADLAVIDMAADDPTVNRR
jgi:hypothetical protein